MEKETQDLPIILQELGEAPCLPALAELCTAPYMLPPF